ncbi:MAG: ATP-binding cassette domain-containing protein, partial [Proteobacteria bacterium]
MRVESLRFNGIGKNFPGVRALSDINFEVRPGSVHALMGENGAGKSTLLKILGGAYQPSVGSLQIGAQTLVFKSAAESIGSGVAVIHQELHLVPEMSVAENLCLGTYPRRLGLFVDRDEMRRRAEAMLARIGVALDVRRDMRELTTAQEQLVQIAGAVGTG